MPKTSILTRFPLTVTMPDSTSQPSPSARDSLSAQEIQEYTIMFNKFEKTGDGKISKQEYCELVETITKKKETLPDSQEEGKQEDFMDMNDFLELIAEQNSSEASIEELKELFDIFDPNESGFINFEEIEYVSNLLGHTVGSKMSGLFPNLVIFEVFGGKFSAEKSIFQNCSIKRAGKAI